MDHEPELSPCPFCGGQAKVSRFPGAHNVWCENQPVTCGNRAMFTVEQWNTRAAHAEDARAAVEDRTPQDYAIEHAGFLATAADQVLADYQAYTLAQMLADEGGDDGEAELTDAIDEARDDLHEGLRNLREMTYEFRKRRDRALPQ